MWGDWVGGERGFNINNKWIWGFVLKGGGVWGNWIRLFCFNFFVILMWGDWLSGERGFNINNKWILGFVSRGEGSGGIGLGSSASKFCN